MVSSHTALLMVSKLMSSASLIRADHSLGQYPWTLEKLSVSNFFLSNVIAGPDLSVFVFWVEPVGLTVRFFMFVFCSGTDNSSVHLPFKTRRNHKEGIKLAVVPYNLFYLD